MAGAIIAVALLTAQASGEPALEAELDGLEQAWRAGAFEHAVEHATNALDVIEASDCPMRSDAAIAAALGGFSSLAVPGRYSGFLFWKAGQVDGRLSVLPEPIVSIVEEMSADPGAAHAYDDDFLRSVYFEPQTLATDCAQARLDPELFFAEPVNAQAVIVAARWSRDYDMAPWRRAKFVYAFPQGEGRALFERLQGERSGFMVQQGVDIRIFDPCLFLPGPDYEYFQICRDGAAP